MTVIGIGLVRIAEKYGTYTWMKYAAVQIIAVQNNMPKMATM